MINGRGDGRRSQVQTDAPRALQLAALQHGSL